MTRHNQNRLREVADLVSRFDARLWSVFFLVETGRAARTDDLSAEEYEQVFQFLYETSLSAPFDIKTTEAQHYRRYAAQRKKTGGATAGGRGGDIISRQAGINDGKGFVFISHQGDVFPSGFLPLKAGNVRQQSLAEIYRHSPLFTALRRTENLKGKCGVCEFREVCGGSRARAYALTGDPFAEEPCCVWQPKGVEVGAAT